MNIAIASVLLYADLHHLNDHARILLINSLLKVGEQKCFTIHEV